MILILIEHCFCCCCCCCCCSQHSLASRIAVPGQVTSYTQTNTHPFVCKSNGNERGLWLLTLPEEPKNQSFMRVISESHVHADAQATSGDCSGGSGGLIRLRAAQVITTRTHEAVSYSGTGSWSRSRRNVMQWRIDSSASCTGNHDTHTRGGLTQWHRKLV